MDPFQPHPGSTFEGYYTRFDLTTGASIVLVVCSVPHAPTRPHMLSFTYIPPPSSSIPIFQREFWPATLPFSTARDSTAFTLHASPHGGLLVAANGTVTYDLNIPDITFSANIPSKTRVPWSQHRSGPEGWLRYLPLPLHWHVHSLSTQGVCTLRLPESVLPIADAPAEQSCTVHQEKNWARSFPTAHMWVQARDANSGASICLAGGRVGIGGFGVTALLLGFRDERAGVEVDMRPPFAMGVCGVAPWMEVEREWDARMLRVSVSDWWHWVEVVAKAPEGTFFGLGAPWPEGHRENAMAESLRATVEVKVWRWSGWWWSGKWVEVCSNVFENGGLEFGGDYFPLAGGEKRWN